MKNGGVMGFLCIVDVHMGPKICAKNMCQTDKPRKMERDVKKIIKFW